MPVFGPLLIILGNCAPLPAQYAPGSPEPISKIRGALLLHGGGSVADSVRAEFVELAGGSTARVVVIPADDADEPVNADLLEEWNLFAPSTVSILDVKSREAALQPHSSLPLADATGVWLCGSKSARLADLYADTPLEDALHEVIHRGGVVGGTSAGIAIAARIMVILGGERRGFDLFPGTIIDQDVSTGSQPDRLQKAVGAHPELVGFAIDPETALILRGRSLKVIGKSEVLVRLAASTSLPERVDRLSAGQTADLIALSRAAQARTQPPFPPAKPASPHVDHGSLFIVGGGKLPRELVARFMELAGGPDSPFVVIPCTEQEVVSGDGFMTTLQKMGAMNVTLLHTKDRQRANRDEEFLAPLKTARGIWFGGGRQWNLVDSYQHTLAHKLMHDVVARGGVIGGSSAGASIQGDFMPRGNPLGNLDIMAEGYEQGLGFLTGVAIDQHFSQRQRFADMKSLVRTHPQLLGIGIDESTAIIVRQHEAEIVGKGNVAFFDSNRLDVEYISVSAGERFDLNTRQVILRE
ncbi:MAG: cyanophycinase [Planctomycetes bacterium]|nr:cyanophycinase [Planctomycetota bacterium]